jgi:F-type H+-transporting ATPase subunit gamma
MASLQEIRNRIISIKTTKKITKAMKLVATAKLRNAKKKLESIKDYCSSIENIFYEIKSNIKDLNKKNNSKKTLYIIISSDIGLCGSYNINIIKLLLKNYKKEDKIIVLGNKGISALKFRKISTDLEVGQIGDVINYDNASIAGNEALKLYRNNKVGTIKIIYTKFVNSIIFNAKIKQILPSIYKFKKENSLMEFEPNPKVILDNITPLYISSLIFNLLVESKVSEMSSRRLAMDNSTENAKELIEKLNLEYNIVRQTNITQEITEIISGSNSNKKEKI